MPKGASARRYAQADFELALEKDELKTWSDDLGYLAQAMETQEFSELLDAPQVTVAQKIALIDETVGGSINPLTRNLLALLASRNSAGLLPVIADAYQEKLDAHLNGLSVAQRRKYVFRAEDKLSIKVELGRKIGI